MTRVGLPWKSWKSAPPPAQTLGLPFAYVVESCTRVLLCPRVSSAPFFPLTSLPPSVSLNNLEIFDTRFVTGPSPK